MYSQTLNMMRILVRNKKSVDNSDVVGASPVGAAPTISSFLNTWLQWIGQRQLQDETRRKFKFCDLTTLIVEVGR